MATTATTVRCTTVRLPAASLGPENPLPALAPRAEPHRLDPRDRDGLPADMARQIGYAPLRSLLPVRLRDGYGRDRAPAELDALVIENDRLRATVLPGLGGRLYSLVHKPDERELLYRNPVFQPADFALAGAWFSGGVEWNLGATGHCAYTCAPLHAARVPAPDGGEMLRLWEWERLRDLPFQIDFWLPEGSDFLHVGVRVRNPHDRTVPAYWWSNAAVPQTAGTRVLAPADAAWHFDYRRTLSRVPVPYGPDVPGARPAVAEDDLTYPLRGEHAADYFFDIPADTRRWVTALDADGRGLVQTSTDHLRGRKLFRWGHGRGGQRWQEWLTEPGTGGYLEIQAGLARTQLEHVPLPAESEVTWLEAYGPLAADPAAVHGDDWAAARGEAADRLEAALPRAAVDAAHTAWLAHADTDPKDVLATGSGWGALEVERGRFHLPGTPFSPATLGDEQRPWRALLASGVLPRTDAGADDDADVGTPPGSGPVGPEWRELLESADAEPGGEWLRDHHLGIAQWAAGDRAQAVRSWERSLAARPTPWTLRALAVAETEAGEPVRAAERYAAAYACLRDTLPSGVQQPGPVRESARAAQRALLVEAVPALLAADRAADAQRILATPAAGGDTPLDDGRIRLLRARTALALGDPSTARALFDEGFVVADLREGDESLSDTWFAIAEAMAAAGGPVTADTRTRAHPLPAAYDFRMGPQAPA